MIPQRFSSWSFVALRGQKRCSPLPFEDRPNHDPAKVFFVALRGPSWTKGVLPRPSWTDQFMIPQRFSSWSFVALRGQKRCSPLPFEDRPNHDPAKVFFVALRGQKRCSPLPFEDRPNHDPAKVFFVALRGPSWTKGVLPRPSWTDQFMIPQRFSSWSFVALRGQKRCSPLPFVDRPNHDPAKVFFAVLRGPSWTKKVFSPALRGQTKS